MDEKKIRALAAELAKGLKTEADLNQFSRMLTKLTVETALNAELTYRILQQNFGGFTSKPADCQQKNSSGGWRGI